MLYISCKVDKFCSSKWWSSFTFIYNRSTNMNYFIYTSHHFNPHGKIWTQWIHLAPNVWLYGSVGRASHRYRWGHGFESRWNPDFFFQDSSFPLLKLENLLRRSLFTFKKNHCTWAYWRFSFEYRKVIDFAFTTLNDWHTKLVTLSSNQK